jgi:hypothetical protein
MNFSEKHIELFEQICAQWNKAEKVIKLAEQVSGKAVIPSINELRYAGRRIIDALLKARSPGSDQDVAVLLAEARFDCHRARHDAIDVGSSIIAGECAAMARHLGYEVILKTCPEFPALIAQLAKARQMIADSRQNREEREKIYAELEDVAFPGLVEKFNALKASGAIMAELAKTQRRKNAFLLWGFIATLAGLALSLIALWK